MNEFDREAAYKRICENPECVKIYDKYIKRGVNKERIGQLKLALIGIPMEWKIIKSETVDERIKRREVLAIKFKELAECVSADIDASCIRIYDENSILTTSPFGDVLNKPTVSSFLNDLSSHIKNLAISQERLMYEQSRPPKKSPKVPEVVQYAARRVFIFLDSINKSRQPPNKDTAVLINNLFDLPDETKLSNNDITQMRKNERHKNWIE
jgi:hypothetical protein